MNELNDRLKRIKHLLACPDCHATLDYQTQNAVCTKCSKHYPIRNGKIYFIPVPEYNDELDALKGKLKNILGKYYYSVGVWIFAPTYPFNYLAEIQKKVILNKAIVVDLGCGNHRIHKDIICLDMFDYKAVDIVCDLKALPFRSKSIDAFASRSVIEHLPEPHLVLKQAYECTKEGGYSIHCIPFLFPFHASPYDFQRYTHKGLEILFKDWKIIEQRNITGPVSMMLANLIEFLSVLLSFGSNKLQSYLYLVFCLLLSPFKYLDWFFVPSKRFYSIAASFLTIAQKSHPEIT